ncbi:MAG TPA: DinB family protein [Vicinamibacterales bacterium]|nr:DinB family protein [Vicinamibacterales bacterium]
MTRVERLAKHIERTITGPQWHGPVLDYVLTGVTAEQAAARPIAGAHSIWELVLHIAAWAEIARARLDGRATADPPPDVDWPPVPDASAQEWEAALHRMRESHRDLAVRVRQLSESALDEKIVGLEYATWYLLHGVVEHSAYHGGQIMMLRKALS